MRAQGRSQLDVALNALATIEEQYLPEAPGRPRTMTARGWEAHAEASQRYDTEVARLPRDDRHLTAAHAPPRPLTTRSTATVVRLAKFSTRRLVRGRAFYLDREPALAVKFVVGASAGQTHVEREIEARTVLAATPHLAAPAIVAARVTPRLAYLAETVVFGRHAHEPSDKQALAVRLVTDLLMTHREVGLTDESITLHRQTLDRLRRLAATPLAAAADRVERLLQHGERLIGDDGLVPVGWCHGDLGFSNVIVGDAGAPTLIDWEHADRMPVAADLAKLAAMSPNQREVVDHIRASAQPGDIGAKPRRRSVDDQLALMILRELSWWESRREAAVAARRVAPYERGIRRRLNLLELLLP